MRLAAFLAALALAAPAIASAQTPASQRPYIAELHRQCPRQRLEDMTAGDLELIMEGFEAHDTLAQTRQLQHAVGRRCALIEGGLTCGNNATLEVFARQHRLKAFVHEACASGWSCRAFGDCAQAKPR
ncbi:MAG: hypothetical protein JSS35_03960 [Proteobacteria bacterium]|nr:hypothetical protein [Pseudomonadota bacterium]